MGVYASSGIPWTLGIELAPFEVLRVDVLEVVAQVKGSVSTGGSV